MAQKNTFYGSNIRKLDAMLALDTPLYGILKDINNNTVGTPKFTRFEYESSGRDHKVKLRYTVDFEVPANARIRKVEIHNEDGQVFYDDAPNVQKDIGPNNTIYKLVEMEAKF